MILFDMKLVLETCVRIYSCFVHEAYVWMKEVTTSDSRAFGESCRREFEKVSFASSGIIPSYHAWSILWFDRLIIFIPYASLAHQATNWFVLGEGVLLRANPGLIKNFDILDDGSQPELGSALL